MSDLFGGQVNPSPPINLFDQLAREPDSTASLFVNSLASQVMAPNADNYWSLKGLPGYQGALSPDVNNTILPSVYNNWQPWNAGLGSLANYVGSEGAGKPSQTTQTAMQNLLAYGGLGGYPTQLMHNMAQFGGTGGPGNQAMSNAMQFGTPSEAGRNIANMAQYGVAGSWGGPLLNRATGGPTAALNYLAPFLNARPYSSGWGR